MSKIFLPTTLYYQPSFLPTHTEIPLHQLSSDSPARQIIQCCIMMLRAQTCFLLPSASCLFYGCFSLYLVLKCVGFLEFYLWPTLHVFLSSHGSHSQRSVSPGKISLPSFEFCIFNCFISSGCLSLFTGLWSPQRWVSCLICYQDLFCRKQFIYSPIECMHKEMDSINVCWMNNKLRWKEKKKLSKGVAIDTVDFIF